MAALDNTKQTIYNFKDVLLDVDPNNEEEIVLNGEDFCNLHIKDVLKEFLGCNIDFKISGAESINPHMFKEEEQI